MIELLVAHIGAPKTATTTLQQCLRLSRNHLENKGVHFIGPGMIRGRSEWEDFWNYYRSDGNGKFPPFAMPENAKTVLLSEESITHDLMPTRRSVGGFKRIKESCDFIDAIEAKQKKIILTVRRQDRFISSSYVHSVHRHKETCEFQQWFRDVVDIERFSWLRVIDSLVNRFGHNNIDVVPLEYLRSTSVSRFANRCFFGSIGEVDYVEPEFAMNPSLGRHGIEIALEINRLCETAEQSESINNSLIKHLPDVQYQPNWDEVINAFKERFSKENEVIHELFDFDDGRAFLFD